MGVPYWLFAILVIVFAGSSYSAFAKGRSMLLAIGLSGLVFLGLFGSVNYFFGLVVSTSGYGMIVMSGVIAGIAIFLNARNRNRSKDKEPTTKVEISKWFWLALIPLAIALVGVLTPSTATDWDSLAYHLALPKIWSLEGKVSSVSFIHHSNFPQAVDGLFLAVKGDETASKLFIWSFTLFGTVAIYGLIAERFKTSTAAICSFAFASIPTVIWESGSAYIDVAHGLYAGIGFVFAAKYIESDKKADALTAGVFLALAAGSKYTGLQSIGIATLVAAIMSKTKSGAFLMGGVAALLASPWYIKNWILVGNPVYPFFFSVFGGKNWNQFAADIYTKEQKDFGYLGVPSFAQSVFGLVTTPGRFTNPSPTTGSGFAFVSLGFAMISGVIAGAVRGLRSRFDLALGAMILIQLFAWIFLSQQSRYILSLAVPMLFLMAGALEWKPASKFITVLVALQGICSIWLIKESVIAERLPVLVGGLTREEFLGGFTREDGSRAAGAVSFYDAAQFINKNDQVKKVALYDELFGTFLNKPYIWAGPGHSTELDYAKLDTSDQLVDALMSLGITHVYLTNKYLKSNPDPTEYERWMGATGFNGPADKFVEKDIIGVDPRVKWRRLMANAIADDRLVILERFSPTRFLFEVKPKK